MVKGFYSTELTEFDELLIKNGLEQSEVARVQDSIRGSFSSFIGGERNTYPTLQDSTKNLEQTQTQHLEVLNNFSLFTSNRVIQDQFMFTTKPSAESIGRLGSEYAALLGQAIGMAEAEKYEWGQRARTMVATGGALFGAARAARGVYNAIRGGRAAVNSIRAAGLIASGASFGAAIVPALITVAISEAILFGAQKLGELLGHNYAYRQASYHVAQGMFDKQRVVHESLPVMGTLAGGAYAGNGLHDYLDRVRDSGVFGLTAGQFGYTYQQTAEFENQIAAFTPFAEQERSLLLGNSLVFSNLVGADEGIVMGAMSSLSRIGDTDTAEVTERFIDFFGALSGDGTVITSHQHMVQSLAEFARIYGYGGKFNENAPEELSKVSSYLRGSEIVNVQHPMAIAETVQTFDSILSAGATLQSNFASRLTTIAGISPGSALRGLTGDADNLPRLINALAFEAGITRESYDNQGNMSEGALGRLVPMLTRGLGMGGQEINQVLSAMETHFTGQPSTRFTSAADYMADRGGKLAGSNPNQIVLNIVEQDIALSRAVLANASAMMDVHDVMMQMMYTESHAFHIAADFAGTALGLLGLDYEGMDIPQPGSPVGSSALLSSLGIINHYYEPASLTDISSIPGVAHTGNLQTRIPELLEQIYKEQGNRRGSPFSSVDEEVRAILALMAPGERDALLANPGFLQHLVVRAREFDLNPLGMLAFYRLETSTTFRPTIANPTSTAVGLNQWMEATYLGMGVSREEILGMSLAEQLDLSLFYMFTRMFPMEVGDSASLMYLLTVAPAHAQHKDSPNHILYAAGTEEARLNPGWQDSAGNVTVSSIGRAVSTHADTMFIDITVDYLDDYPEMVDTIRRNIEEGLLHEVDGGWSWRRR